MCACSASTPRWRPRAPVGASTGRASRPTVASTTRRTWCTSSAPSPEWHPPPGWPGAANGTDTWRCHECRNLQDPDAWTRQIAGAPRRASCPSEEPMSNVANITSTIIPCLRYRDAPAAIDWLCRAFGFERHAVYADGDTVHHAQLTFGNGMVMLGSTGNDSEWGRQIVQPEQTGLRETQSPCVVVRDVDAHYAQATAAGATVVQDIADQGYGGRGYSCRDPEGHLWWFGSYDPWAA